jgi:hypothetical protein
MPIWTSEFCNTVYPPDSCPTSGDLLTKPVRCIIAACTTDLIGHSAPRNCLGHSLGPLRKYDYPSPGGEHSPMHHLELSPAPFVSHTVQFSRLFSHLPHFISHIPSLCLKLIPKVWMLKHIIHVP